MSDATGTTINVAAMIDSSFANGPGDRCVLWVQGCPRRCDGCCNLDFQDMDRIMSQMPVEDVAGWICSNVAAGMRGLSLSGGEPMHPSHLPSIRLAIEIARRSTSFDVLAFTGYTVEELGSMDLAGIDLLIAGPYDRTLHHDSGLISSVNQEIVRLTDAFLDVPDGWFWESERAMEVILEDGVIHVTGLYSPEEVHRFLRG